MEAHCLEAKMKANKAVEEERWAVKGKESVTCIVEYEEKLGTPVAPTGRSIAPLSDTPIPQD